MCRYRRTTRMYLHTIHLNKRQYYVLSFYSQYDTSAHTWTTTQPRKWVKTCLLASLCSLCALSLCSTWLFFSETRAVSVFVRMSTHPHIFRCMSSAPSYTRIGTIGQTPEIRRLVIRGWSEATWAWVLSRAAVCGEFRSPLVILGDLGVAVCWLPLYSWLFSISWSVSKYNFILSTNLN